MSHAVPPSDPVEAALAAALTAAVSAQRWELVSQLGAELTARRRARLEVTNLDEVRSKRKGESG